MNMYKPKKRIFILYDEVARHYHMIVNITGAMARQYFCKGCKKDALRM